MQNNNNNDNGRFVALVEELRNNTIGEEIEVCAFPGGHGGGRQPRWSLLQAKELYSALKANTTVTNVYIEPMHFPIPAIPPLLDYIQSNPRLQDVNVFHHALLGDDPETREKYQRHIGGIFRSVEHNPAIKKFSTNELGSNPPAVFDLLSKTKTLEHFEISAFAVSPTTAEMARHVAAGIAQASSSLAEVSLCMPIDSLTIALSGIPVSTIKTLSVDLVQPTANFYSVISNMLPVSRYLKTLVVNNEHSDIQDESGVEELLKSLRNPGCGVEKLELRMVRLGSLTDVSTSSSSVNHNLKVLILQYMFFSSKKAVRLLPFVGLNEVRITYPRYYENETDPDGWAEVFGRNPGLLKLSVLDTAWNDAVEGIVIGTCGHPSLETLELHVPATMEAHVGSQFCRLLRETPQLKKFTLTSFTIEREGAHLMVEGLCQSKNLQHFRLQWCDMSFAVLTIIVESFVFNQTVKVCDIRHGMFDGDANDKRAFCQTLSRVFGENMALESFCLPSMAMTAENGLMSVLVAGLSRSTTIKTIDFSSCTLDDAALTSLEQALVGGNEHPGTISVSSIQLPRLSTEEGIKSFLRNLVRMPSIKKVTMPNILDAEGKHLLLQAVQEKKKLHSFERGGTNLNNSDPVDDEIDFYLKINRLGRQIVEYPNVPASCWPILMNHTRCKQHNDEDALFYFVREYFANHHAPNKPQAQQQPRLLEQPASSKRARLE